ncbi:MAG: alpha-L-arabinofuranosidase C-terminal domain-containing protein [Tepidisphaeraceae bacterium]
MLTQFLVAGAALITVPLTTLAMPTTLTIEDAPKRISPDLFGIFFEDLNYAADGGLYAELIRNRSFDFQPTEQPTWNALSFWTVSERGGAKGSLLVDDSLPLHANNPTYGVLNVGNAGTGDGAGVSIVNEGFDGIPVAAGETYDFAVFARQLYLNDRWGPGSKITGPMPIVARLETKDGELLAEAKLSVDGRDWKKLEAELNPTKSDRAARFVLIATARGGIAIDEVSLFPRKTFRNRKNGLRADLAQTIADLKPKFMRFPGGCLAHGAGLSNMYRWKDTTGPIETRRGQRNLWGYHQTGGLGYFEYFQFCEDIGAKPLPVVPAGVSCQNSGHTSGIGQQCLPMDQMPTFIQDCLDLIEYANGPVTSTWGAKRAAAGHPEPFNLQYLGVGNEDHITPGFEERFRMIHDAIKTRHPEITVVGTVGPAHSGEDYDNGWDIARKMNLAMVDEHYYVSPDWFWDNLGFYDKYDRNGSHVYLGEYAAHDRERRSTLRSALAEAAYMTTLERNGDVVRFASYAPLLAKQGHTQWRPDLIYFDNNVVSPTINYHVQKLFATNSGDASLPAKFDEASKDLTASCVRDSVAGDVVVKVVSRAKTPIELKLQLPASIKFKGDATQTTLAGDPDAENTFGEPASVLPATTTVKSVGVLTITLPATSFTVLRFGTEASTER